ncbi:MAG: hypothetical protein SGI92_14655 [Bryobacteraceae bacterium]|nr:hypothetical protein [Bryobacteraceae bacterium]
MASSETGSTRKPEGQPTGRQHVAEPPASSIPGLLERVNPLHSVLRHRYLALGLLFVVTAIGLPVAWLRGKPVYYTEAVVFVSPRFLKNLQDDKELEMQSNSQYREYVQQNVRTINRFDIVDQALQASPAFKTSFRRPNESDRRLAERIQASLEIKPVTDTYQITVGLEADTTEGLAEFLNKLVTIYLGKAKGEEFYASDERLASLAKEGTQLAADIAGKQEQRTQLAQELGVSTFTENYINPYDRLLVSAKEALADSRRKRIEADAAVTMLEGPKTGNPKAWVEAFALDAASKDAAVTTALAALNARRAELLTRSSGLAERHPGRIAAQQEIAEIDNEKRKVLDGLVSSYSRNLVDQRRAEARRARQVEEALSSEVDTQQSQAAFFTRKYQEGISMGLQIDRARKRFDSIDDRSRFLTQEGRAPGFVRMFSEARTPELPIRGGKRKIALLFVIAGLLLAIVIPVGLDVLDPRVFSPTDAARVSGLPLLAWLPDRKQFSEAFWSEQVLRLAHRIDQDRTANGTRIWCFTGAHGKAGTTTVVRALGKALTDLGVSVLTVEADPRTATQSGGLTVLLQGHSTLTNEIEREGDAAPDRLSAGQGDGSGHLPDIHRLLDVLREAANVYGTVLVDVPAVASSVDSEYVSSRADAVVLIARAGSNGAQLTRALKLLERNRPRAVATVLNATPRECSATVEREYAEFRDGTAPTEPGWRTPWLWR